MNWYSTGKLGGNRGHLAVKVHWMLGKHVHVHGANGRLVVKKPDGWKVIGSTPSSSTLASTLSKGTVLNAVPLPLHWMG